jgi:GNAT superfamily N-acetyltransferase
LFVTNPNFFGLVAEDNNKLVGMLGIILAPHLFNNKVIVAEEIAWWVEPEHRKGVGEDMLRIAEAALKKKGVKHFSMKYLTNKNMSPEIMKKLYGRKGYKETEIVMMKEL